MDTITTNPTHDSPNVYLEACPTRQILDLIADKWTALVVGLLENQPKRFSQLHREIEGISQKMLTQTLRALERNGIITRRVYPEVPPRVEYALTDLGKSVSGLLCGIRNWAESNIREIESAQRQYDGQN